MTHSAILDSLNDAQRAAGGQVKTHAIDCANQALVGLKLRRETGD